MKTIAILPLNQVVTAIDWNVILMIAGTMGVVGLFGVNRCSPAEP